MLKQQSKHLAVGTLALCVVIAAAAWLNAAPAIGPVAVTPAYVVINTPTDLLFTAQITEPSVISTGVNLLRVDAAGRTLGVVGTMRDDGTGGDSMSGDKVFSLTLSLNKTTAGQEYYRVSAAFKGVLLRSTSTIRSVSAMASGAPSETLAAISDALMIDDVDAALSLFNDSDNPGRTARVLRQRTSADLRNLSHFFGQALLLEDHEGVRVYRGLLLSPSGTERPVTFLMSKGPDGIWRISSW